MGPGQGKKLMECRNLSAAVASPTFVSTAIARRAARSSTRTPGSAAATARRAATAGLSRRTHSATAKLPATPTSEPTSPTEAAVLSRRRTITGLAERSGLISPTAELPRRTHSAAVSKLRTAFASVLPRGAVVR